MKFQDLKKEIDDVLALCVQLHVSPANISQRDDITKRALKCMQNGSVFGPQWAKQLLRMYQDG